MPHRRNPRTLALTPELVASIECPLPNRDDESGKARLSDAEYETHARDLLDQGPDGPIWLFAYGSLIWNPAFDHDHHVIATVHGYRRSFCMDLTGWRATPEQPGLMMALDRGGACTGLAYRLTPGDRRAQMVRLLQREVPFADGLPWVRWLNCRANGETLRALVFYAAPRHDPGGYLIRLDEATQADRLSRACGHMGSCAAYLRNTVEHLEQAGIHDRYLWRMQQQVAERIGRAAPLAVQGATR